MAVGSFRILGAPWALRIRSDLGSSSSGIPGCESSQRPQTRSLWSSVQATEWWFPPEISVMVYFARLSTTSGSEITAFASPAPSKMPVCPKLFSPHENTRFLSSIAKLWKAPQAIDLILRFGRLNCEGTRA